MKTALVILLDDNFMKGFIAFWESFISHNPWFDLPLIVFDVGLSDKNKSLCKNIYGNIIFRDIEHKNYENINYNKTHERLKKTFYFLDVFLIRDFDKIVVMDLDLIVLDNVKDLFYDYNSGIWAAQRYNAGNDSFGPGINSGVFVVNKELLNDAIYNDLITLAGPGAKMPDQSIIDNYFSLNMNFLPKHYNCEKRIWKSKFFEGLKVNASIWHFVGLKPWEDKTGTPESEKGFEELEKMWNHFYIKGLERVKNND